MTADNADRLQGFGRKYHPSGRNRALGTVIGGPDNARNNGDNTDNAYRYRLVLSGPYAVEGPITPAKDPLSKRREQVL